MKISKVIAAAALGATAFYVPASAQDADFQLPAQCISATAMDHGAMQGDQMGGMMGMMGMDPKPCPSTCRKTCAG